MRDSLFIFFELFPVFSRLPCVSSPTTLSLNKLVISFLSKFACCNMISRDAIKGMNCIMNREKTLRKSTTGSQWSGRKRRRWWRERFCQNPFPQPFYSTLFFDPFPQFAFLFLLQNNKNSNETTHVSPEFKDLLVMFSFALLLNLAWKVITMPLLT